MFFFHIKSEIYRVNNYQKKHDFGTKLFSNSLSIQVTQC